MVRFLQFVGQMRSLLFTVLILTACTPESHPVSHPAEPNIERSVSISFEALIDPQEGTMTITLGEARGLAPVAVEQDGTPGIGSPNTVELVTLTTDNDTDGTGTCGYPSSFCGDVLIRSFYDLTLNNVFSEVTSITPPTGHEGLNSDPAQMGLSNTLGLWGYGTLRTNESNNRLWVFGDTGVPYIVRGRIMADVLPEGIWDNSTWDNATWQ